MIRIIGWTLTAAVAGAGLFFLGTVVFVELLQTRLFPPKPGEGFNSLGLALYLFGSPSGAVIGATAGLLTCLYRWRQPGSAPANRFGYAFSCLAAIGVLCLFLVLALRGEKVKPLGWLLLGGLTADAVIGAAACFWLGSRSVPALDSKQAEPGAADGGGGGKVS